MKAELTTLATYCDFLHKIVHEVFDFHQRLFHFFPYKKLKQHTGLGG